MFRNLYFSNNFDDFFSAIVLLWDLLVVNNWHVFLHVFRDEINPWAQLYFITWWLTAAVIILNIFVALILDNFIGIGLFGIEYSSHSQFFVNFYFWPKLTNKKQNGKHRPV